MAPGYSMRKARGMVRFYPRRKPVSIPRTDPLGEATFPRDRATTLWHPVRVTTAEAIRIAQQAVERDGRRLRDYKPPEAHFEYTREDKSWFVFFDGRVPMPGNHFSVSIDDRTGNTELMPGL